MRGVIANPNDKRVSEIARACLLALSVQLRRIKEQILEFDRRIRAWHRSCETSRPLDAIPGVGPTLATALVASTAGYDGLDLNSSNVNLEQNICRVAQMRL
jgi:transposase